MDKVTHDEHPLIINLDQPSIDSFPEKAKKTQKKDSVFPPFSNPSNHRRRQAPRGCFTLFPREAIDHKVAAASMTRINVLGRRNRATRPVQLIPSWHPLPLPLPPSFPPCGGALHYFSALDPSRRRAESKGIYFRGWPRRVHRGRVQWRACPRNRLNAMPSAAGYWTSSRGLYRPSSTREIGCSADQRRMIVVGEVAEA